MPKTIDETLLPRPPQLLDVPAAIAATRRTTERLIEQFNLTPEAAEAFAAAAVDPAEVRKAAENPELLYVPGGTLLGLRTRVWTRRIMPDPRNPRVGPARRHPAAIRPGTSEESRHRPIPDPDADPDGRPELVLRVEDRDHLSWAAAIAKKFILKDNDWRMSIRNQGVMTEVWLSAVTLVHGDDTPSATVPVTSEGSSRLTAGHDILDVRSSDVPYSRDDKSLRAIIRSLNDAYVNGPTPEQAEALRCETIPALLLVGFEPNPGSSATFATAVRSLVALRHVDTPKPWDEAAKMEAIADAVLESLAEEGLISADEELWLAGALMPEEAEARRFSPDPAVRAARIVRLLTDADASVQHTVRAAITGQSTRQRITNKFKLQVAAALIMRSVVAQHDRDKVTDIHRALRDGFSDLLASSHWTASYRPTEEVVASAVKELERGEETGPASLELAARAAYPLIVSRQLWGDRGTAKSDQVDRRLPALVVERMRTSVAGVRQLGQALADHAAQEPIRAVDEDGTIRTLDDGSTQVISDDYLRRSFSAPGKPVAPASAATAHEKLLVALSEFGESMEAALAAGRRLSSISGLDGRPLIDSEGIDPGDAESWSTDLMQLFQKLTVWKAIFGPGGVTTATSDNDLERDDDDEADADGWED